jgi:hypothetical protein
VKRHCGPRGGAQADDRRRPTRGDFDISVILNLGAINLQLCAEEHQRLERVSRPTLIYPFWHQRKTAADRLGIATGR